MKEFVIALLGRKDEPTDAVVSRRGFAGTRDSTGNPARTLGKLRLVRSASRSAAAGGGVSRNLGACAVHGARLVSARVSEKNSARAKDSRGRGRSPGRRLAELRVCGICSAAWNVR
jgi:hypothetical protein